MFPKQHFLLFASLFFFVLLLSTALGQRQQQRQPEWDDDQINEPNQEDLLDDALYLTPHLFASDAPSPLENFPHVGCQHGDTPVELSWADIPEGDDFGVNPTATVANRTVAFMFFKFADQPTNPPQVASFYVNNANATFGTKSRSLWTRSTQNKLRLVGAAGRTTPDAIGYIQSSLRFNSSSVFNFDIYHSKVLPLAKLTTTYQHYVYTPTYSLTGGGVAQVPGSLSSCLNFNTPTNFDWYNNQQTFIHEFGHNLGLNHANSLDCSSSAGKVSATCTSVGYGDPTDAMGCCTYPVNNRVFSNPIKYFKMWLSDTTYRTHTSTTTATNYLLTNSAISTSLTVQTGKVFMVLKNNKLGRPFTSFTPQTNFSYAIEHNVKYGTGPQVSIRLIENPFTLRKIQPSYPYTYYVAGLNKTGAVFDDRFLNLRVVVTGLNATHAQIAVTAPY